MRITLPQLPAPIAQNRFRPHLIETKPGRDGLVHHTPVISNELGLAESLSSWQTPRYGLPSIHGSCGQDLLSLSITGGQQDKRQIPLTKSVEISSANDEILRRFGLLKGGVTTLRKQNTPLNFNGPQFRQKQLQTKKCRQDQVRQTSETNFRSSTKQQLDVRTPIHIVDDEAHKSSSLERNENSDLSGQQTKLDPTLQDPWNKFYARDALRKNPFRHRMVAPKLISTSAQQCASPFRVPITARTPSVIQFSRPSTTEFPYNQMSVTALKQRFDNKSHAYEKESAFNGVKTYQAELQRFSNKARGQHVEMAATQKKILVNRVYRSHHRA